MSSTVTITGLAFGGRGVGRIDGKVVFVPLTAPGDEAVVELTSQKKGFAEAALTGLLLPSLLRAEPACKHYGSCGGCSWMHLQYGTQLEWKQRILAETLRRIGGIKDVSFDVPVAANGLLGYRSRARFHSDGTRLGFYAAASHALVPIDACPLLEPRVNAAYDELRGLTASVGEMLLDSVEIDVGAEGLAVAALHVNGRPHPGLLSALQAAATLKGFEVWNKTSGKLASSGGDCNIRRRVKGMPIDSGVGVFSQANRAQNEALVDKVVEYAGLTGSERVLDLYCGCGNLGLPLSGLAKKVIGVESDERAVERASSNAALNSVGNAFFYASDAGRWLCKNAKNLEVVGADVVVLDPPRDGEFDAIKALTSLRPSRIIYVSCNPPALARDAGLLARAGYKVARAGLIDMFPQTYHIESIIKFDLA